MTNPLITCDPAILCGKPTIKGTRIGVDLILSMLGDGESMADILVEYPHLRVDQIRACFSYAAANLPTHVPALATPRKLPSLPKGCPTIGYIRRSGGCAWRHDIPTNTGIPRTLTMSFTPILTQWCMHIQANITVDGTSGLWSAYLSGPLPALHKSTLSLVRAIIAKETL